MIVIDFLTLPSHQSMVWYQYYHKLISFIIFNDNTGTKNSKEYWDDVRSLFSKINSEEKRQYLYLIFLSSVHPPFLVQKVVKLWINSKWPFLGADCSTWKIFKSKIKSRPINANQTMAFKHCICLWANCAQFRCKFWLWSFWNRARQWQTLFPSFCAPPSEVHHPLKSVSPTSTINDS